MQAYDKEKLKKVQRINLEMAEYFVDFCQKMIYCAISVAEGVLVLFVIKVLYHGMMILIFSFQGKITKD